MHAPQADHQQSQQHPPPPPPSQTYGVSFTGTAKFAPLPFPPCEHRLPPPSTSTGTRVPPLATIQHGVLLPHQQQHPPPPSYTESCTSSSGSVVVGGALDAHNPSPSSVASTLLFPPTPAPPPPPPQTSSSSLLHHHLALPFVPQVAASPPPPPSSSAVATPNLVLVSVPPPPPPVPVPMLLSTSSGMVPYGHHAPILTPWPPIPLRHIDSYLAGNWPPPPLAPQQVVHVPNQNPSFGIAQQQPPQFKTDLVTFPVQFGGGGGLGFSQTLPAENILASTSVSGDVLASHGTPLAASLQEKYPEMTTSAPAAAPAPANVTAPAPAPAPAPPPDARCQAPGCQAHAFCQLSPCHCRICRDHLGWVMRGVRIVDAETGVEIEPDKFGEVETETKKMYRCIACGWQSTMESAAGTGGGGGGISPSKKSAQQEHRKALSDVSGTTTKATTTTTAATTDANAKVNANAFSIHYFSHGPVSHPQPQPQPPTHPSFAQGVYHVTPMVWPMAEGSGGEGAGPAAVSPGELATHTAAATSSSGIPIDFSTVLNPTRDAASLVAVPYGPRLLPSTNDQPYALEAGHQHMRETFAAHQEGLDSPLVTSSYPIPTQTPQTTQVETTDKQPASFDYNAKSIASPRTAEHEKAEALEVETASLPPRCRSAVGSPTSAGSPETDTTAPPLQNRPASSPSTLETAVTVSPSQGSAAPHAPPPLPSSPSSPCHTPSPVSTSPFYTQAYGGYGTLSSPPIMRDDTYPFGYDAPYFGGSRSSSYPPFMPPQPYGPTAEGFLPIGDGPIQLPPGGLMREADLQQQQGIATPGLGLLGMPAPPLSSYVTPPRMTHRKRQSYAGRTGKMSPFEKRHPPVAELGFASPGQQSPVRTFQLPPEVDGSLLEPREWPIVKIENIPFNTTIAHLESWLPRGVLAPASQVVLPIHLILHRASGRTLPHCYIECHSQERATELILGRDRSRLGDRTVRVKWERAGELLRDLFDQSVYFVQPSPSPAAAPLPHLPPEGFRLPDKLLTRTDLDQLTDYCTKVQVGFRERPFERAYFNLPSIIAKFPWQRQDLWDAELRAALFQCAYECIRHAVLNCRRPGGEALGYRRMAAVINISMQRCSVFSRSEKEQCRVLLGSGPVSLPAPPAMAQPPATEGDFPSLQISQPAKPTSPSDQHTPLAGGLYTPPRGGREGEMRLPDSPETPTPMHVRAGPTRTAVTTASTASTFSAGPRIGPALFVRPENKAAFVGGGWQGDVTSRPLSQPSQDTASASEIDPRKQLQSALSTRSAESLNERRSFPQQRAPVSDAAKAASAASTPPSMATTALTKTGQAFGWLATPPESPTEERPRGAKALAERAARSKAEQKKTTSKGWAQE